MLSAEFKELLEWIRLIDIISNITLIDMGTAQELKPNRSAMSSFRNYSTE